jgi:putative transposase
MPDYRRNRVPGGTFFFTVNLFDRRSNLLVAQIDALRDAVRQVRARAPFHIDAWVVLPDHMHCLWTLPEGDADFPGRWRAIKTAFAKSLPIGEPRSPAMTSRGERGIWQRRYWEHTIRDDRDFAAHLDYTHFNPIKHGLVRHPADWPGSSFRRCVAQGRGQGTPSGRMDRRQRRATRDGRAALTEVAECALLFRPTFAA